MYLSLIVAMAKNRVIGKNGQIPWYIPEDLKYFKKITMGYPVIMGRKTFQSIGKALPGRPNLVVSRNKNFFAPNIEVFSTIDAALKQSVLLQKVNKLQNSFVIGGAELYSATMDHIDRLYITEVDLNPDGDTWFPEIDYDHWKQIKNDYRESNSSDKTSFTFKIFNKIK